MGMILASLGIESGNLILIPPGINIPVEKKTEPTTKITEVNHMKKKFIIAGALVALILMATLGTVIALDDSGLETDAAATTDTLEDENAQYLITEEQLEEIRDASEQMIIDQMIENLESYNLTDEQITEIEDILLAIRELRGDIRATLEELRDRNTTFPEIREALEPLVTELRALRAELKELLDSYGILPPEGRMHCIRWHRGPRFGGPGSGPRPGGPGIGDGGMGPGFGGPRP